MYSFIPSFSFSLSLLVVESGIDGMNYVMFILCYLLYFIY